MDTQAMEPFVLVVEEDKGVGELVCGLVHNELGYPVMLSPSGEEALGVLQTSRPRFVILDTNLSGIDGYAVFAMIVANTKYGNPEVLFISPEHTEKNVKARDSRPHLAPSFDAAPLMKKMHRLIQ